MVYYSSDNIARENATYNLIYGERSNGKSYDIKHKWGLEYFVNKNRKLFFEEDSITPDDLLNIKGRFVLVRRTAEQLKNERIESYFSDCDIRRITNGKYNIISVYRKEIYFSNYDVEKNIVKRGIKIGYAIPLSLEQNYAGSSFLDVDNIIVEEFMSRDEGYLRNESTKLQNLFSTIDRKRGTTKVWLVGNTISRICPYLYDWGLIDMVKNQPQGNIITKEMSAGFDKIEGKEVFVKLALEFCESTGRTSFAFGEHSEMLNTGVWQTDKQPTLENDFRKYEQIIKIGFEYMGFKYLGRLLADNDSNLFWFISPFTKKENFKDVILIFSDRINIDKKYQRDIYNITLNHPKLKNILNSTFKESMIFYSDDLTGTEFKNAIDFIIRK